MSLRMIILLIATSLPAFASIATADDLRIANGRVSMPIGGEDPTVFFVIQSKSKETRTIVGASSPRSESVSIRRTAIVEGQWGSEAMPDGMAIPPGGAVAFAPRGLFLRMMSAEKLAAGDVVPITLEFANGESVSFDAVTKGE